VLLAELEIRHTRANLPTRRVALGLRWLPVDPAPGFGGVLLAGIAASRAGELDPDERKELDRLIDDVEAGTRFAQPRLRHRFQRDVVGLDRSRHKLMADGELLWFDLDTHGAPVPQLLGVVYAAGEINKAVARKEVFRVVRRATHWRGPVGSTFVTWLSTDEAATRAWRAHPTDERWALQTLGFDADDAPDRDVVLRRFRDLVRLAHPDHGAAIEGAGQRILELTEARRILLGSVGGMAGA
jgi:hypothetical protein